MRFVLLLGLAKYEHPNEDSVPAFSASPGVGVDFRR